ncbi:hypothetical protein GCM10010425_05080 [Streptomyces spororaveus]|uniref:Uncharacterized protein n=1 Tax=Streptomyces spororaveus TaxID=284039 RepID=A0ABQ3TFP5_9ACTN|nr:hypothetical protein Sspor_47230 [Streptomyces spororaveus]
MRQAEAAGDPEEHRRCKELVAAELRSAHDPLPGQRAALQVKEQALLRGWGQPAVLVRGSAPDRRDVFHSDVDCGLIGGEGRRPGEARWILAMDAEEAGYRPCSRCGSSR